MSETNAGIVGEESAGGGDITYATFDATRTGTGLILSGGGLIATNVANAWRSSFFTIDKVSGLWAAEFSILSGSEASASPALGCFSPRLSDVSTFIGDSSGAIGCYPILSGAIRDNGTAVLNYFDDIASTDTSPILTVFDMGTRKCLQSKAGVLKLTPAALSTDPLFIGTSLFGIGSSVRVNAGQTAFSAGNEDLIAAYELANSVVINRGIYE